MKRDRHIRKDGWWFSGGMFRAVSIEPPGFAIYQATDGSAGETVTYDHCGLVRNARDAVRWLNGKQPREVAFVWNDKGQFFGGPEE